MVNRAACYSFNSTKLRMSNNIKIIMTFLFFFFILSRIKPGEKGLLRLTTRTCISFLVTYTFLPTSLLQLLELILGNKQWGRLLEVSTGENKFIWWIKSPVLLPYYPSYYILGKELKTPLPAVTAHNKKQEYRQLLLFTFFDDIILIRHTETHPFCLPRIYSNFKV